MPPTPGRSSIGVRVRPNANDFIKDLERQLKSKKQTFYVDVRANMGPANRDVQEWARGTLKKIRATIPVGINTHLATAELADWRRKAAGKKTNIPVGVNLSGAYASVMNFRKIAGKDIEVDLRVNVESANKAAERFQQAIARRGITLPMNVDADVRKAANTIDTDLVQRLKSQGGIVLGVDADTTPAERKIAETKAKAKAQPVKSELELEVEEAERKLRELRIREEARKIGVKVDIDADPTKANMQLRLLRAKAAAQKLELNVDVKRRGLDAFDAALKGIEKRLGSFTVIRSLDLGPLNLGKPTGLMGTLTTVNLLAGAVPGATFVVTGLSKALTDLSGAAAIVPGAIGGILASVGTLTVGLSGVGDAFSALTDMWTETGSEQASTARRSVQAQNQLRQSVRDEAQAQRDVASARREATNDLRNLNNELRGSVLNEAQAILDLQKARDRLAQGGFENATDQKQAELDVAKAQQNVIDVRERNVQLQEKANTESAKGVEGSDKVTSALERQTRAAESTAQALEAIQSAQATGTLGKFKDELDQLTPSARDFVLTIAGFKGEMMDLRNGIQETMFQGTGPAFAQMFNNLLPVVGPGMQRIAHAMNQSMLQVFDSLGSPQGQSIIDRILGGTGEAQEHLTKLIDPMVRGVGTLMAAGAEHLPQVVDLFGRLADRFADFIEEADKSGKLDEFMDRGIGALSKLAELGINLIQIVYNLGEAFEGDMLQGLVDVTQKFEDWIKSAEGQQKINEWIQQAKDLWNDWKPVLQDLPEIFSAVSSAAKNLIDGITPFLNLFTSVMKEAPGLVQGFVTVWLGSKLITGFLSPVAGLLGGIIKGFKGLPGLISRVASMSLPSALTSSLNTGGAGGAAKPGARPGVAPVLGSAGIAAAGTLAVTDIMQRISFASDAESKYNEWKSNREKLPNDEERRKLDKEFYGSVGIDLGNETIYPMMGPHQFVGLFQGAGTEHYRAHDGKIYWQGGGGEEKELHNFDRGFAKGGYTGFTNWGVEQGQMAMLHGREYVQPHDTTDYYGVGAMEAIHHKRVPRELLQRFAGVPMGMPDQRRGFWPGGLFDPLNPLGPPPGPPQPVAPVTPDPAAPGPLGVSHHGGPGVDPSAAAPALGEQPAAPGEVGPIGTDTDSQSSINILGFNIPINTGQQTKTEPVDYSDPAIWPFGVPGIGKPGTTEADAGKWLADWGAKTVLGFGENVLSGVLGFFGAEGLLNNDYMNGLRTAIGYYSNLNSNVKGQASGADATNASVDQSLNTFYNMPVNGPGGTGPISPLPTVVDPKTGKTVSALDVTSRFPGVEPGLKPQTLATLRAVAAQFPDIQSIGGVRSDPLPDHPSGHGLDVMIPNYDTPEGKAYGDQVNAWLRSHASELGIKATIWQDKWSRVSDQASSNVPGHMNHIHVQMAYKDEEVPSLEQVLADPAAAAAMLSTDGSLPATVPQTLTGIPALDDLNSAINAPSDSGSGWFPGKSWGGGNTSGSVGALGTGLGGGPRINNGPLPTQGGKPVSQLPLSQMFGDRGPGGPTNPLSAPLGGLRQGQGPSMPGTGKKMAPDQIKAIAKQLYVIQGMPPGEWPAFERLIQKESSWDPTAKNPASTAYGLGQFLDTTQAQYGITGNSNPVSQIFATFRYIRDRYHGSPAEALNFHNRNNWYDRGGWLMPGQSHVDNATGKPELVVPWDQIPSFAYGGLNTGMVQPPRPPAPPLPRPPNAIQMKPTPSQQRPVAAPPPPSPPPMKPPAPPPIASAPGPPPPPPSPGAPAQAGSPDQSTVVPLRLGPGPGAGAESAPSHLHPAAAKGITSGFAAAGNIAGSMMGAAGLPGGSLVAGAFGQAGKIVEGIANVGAAFLVGNVTNGTTENPYGVTQRGSNPTGGTRISDNSTHYHGDLVTNNLDDYFRRQDLREKQKQQASLGRFG